MRRPAALVTALALGTCFSLPAQAEAGDALDRVLEGNVLESLVARALAGIDIDALIAGFEHSARAVAEGRPLDAEAMARSQAQIEAQMARTGPALARDAAGVLGPVLRELRIELAREMADAGRD